MSLLRSCNAHDARGGYPHDTWHKDRSCDYVFTRITLWFHGRVFRSPMSFGQYDLHGEVYDHFCEVQIVGIILLAEEAGTHPLPL